MISFSDFIGYQILSVIFTNPAILITYFFALLLWYFIIGIVIAFIFKKYEFFGYPLKEWPGCGYLSLVIAAAFAITGIIIGNKTLSDGVAMGISMVVLLVVIQLYYFVGKISKNK